MSDSSVQAAGGTAFFVRGVAIGEASVEGNSGQLESARKGELGGKLGRVGKREKGELRRKFGRAGTCKETQVAPLTLWRFRDKLTVPSLFW